MDASDRPEPLSAAHRNRQADEAEAQRRRDMETCWLCGEPTLEIHCKIVCPRCGFRRDCSDP